MTSIAKSASANPHRNWTSNKNILPEPNTPSQRQTYRNENLIDRVSSENIDIAKKIAAHITTKVKVVKGAYTIFTRRQQFVEEFHSAANALGLIGKSINTEVIAVAIYHSSYSTANPQGKIKGLWSLVFNGAEIMSFGESKVSVSALRGNLAKYLLSDLLNCRSAEDLENLKNTEDRIRHLGLKFAFESTAPYDLVKLAYPELMSTPSRLNPSVRPWLVEGPGKWRKGKESREMAGNAIGWLMAHELEIVDLEKKTFDKKKFLATAWTKTFKEHNLRGVAEGHPSVKGDLLAFLKLAEQSTGVRIFGRGRDYVAEWELQIPNKWLLTHNGNKLIDLVTARVVERLRKEHPEKFVQHENEIRIVPSKILDVPFAVMYEEEATLALRACRMRPHEALARVHPYIFGWEPGQILPLHMNIQGKFAGPEALNNLRIRMAHAFHAEGLGFISHALSSYEYIITTSNLDRWLEHQSLEGFADRFRAKHRLIAPIDKILNGSFPKAIGVLFSGNPTVPEYTCSAPKISYIFDLMRHFIANVHKGKFAITFKDDLHEHKPIELGENEIRSGFHNFRVEQVRNGRQAHFAVRLSEVF